MVAGTLCYLVSILATSFSVHYYQYVLSQGILFGLSVGLLCAYDPFPLLAIQDN